MKEKSIELLNRAVADELTAVHQYMYFHFHCDDQGYDLLAGLFRRTAIEEMQHIELLAERILFLGGEVELKASGDVKKIHNVKEMLEMGGDMETQSVNDYNKWANECARNADSVSKKIFEQLVEDESAILTSMMSKWRISKSSETTTWHFNRSREVKIFL